MPRTIPEGRDCGREQERAGGRRGIPTCGTSGVRRSAPSYRLWTLQGAGPPGGSWNCRGSQGAGGECQYEWGPGHPNLGFFFLEPGIESGPCACQAGAVPLSCVPGPEFRILRPSGLRHRAEGAWAAMRDRTHELRQGDNSSDEEDEERVALVVRPGTARLGSPDDEFFQKVRTIRQSMGKLESKVRELEKQQATILGMPLPEESMKQDLQNLRDEITQLGSEIRTQLHAIEPQKEEADENYNSINTRMRKTQHGVLSQKFVEIINKCNAVQSEYREKNVERIRRQLNIIHPGTVSDEELERALNSEKSEVFISNILKDTQMTRKALNEISARHTEIQQLERSIRELHEIFTFLATEVEMQGEMINRIEKNILSSADYVERGQEHVKLALEHQKKARKKKIMIAICVSITVVILVVIIGITAAI
ncbi:PREDICTED: syntaxin-4 [Chinchilla lanigera]|nr:PREDICTED: syntaxin-4 [Chinchilla lanigera]